MCPRFQNRGTHGRHILQDAIQLQDYKMVDMLVEAGADVNIRVHVKEYFRVGQNKISDRI